ncbi:MAG: OmpP1/FadL family transporter, partial [Burkholderiales bacterium]|nr:OmpP1/FadL family transporter [Burkholderiales bacterium]
MQRIAMKTLSATLCAAGLCALPGHAGAAAFFLPYQGAAAVGNSLAGSAALGEDASTVYFNPAGMSRLQTRQVTIAGHYVDPSFKYTDTGSTGPAAFTGGNGGDFAPNTALPVAFAVFPMGAWRFGLGISAPFGSKTDYEAGWRGRFQADFTELQVININPSVSYQVADWISAGVGLNYVRAEADIQRSQLLGPSEGRVRLTGEDSAFSYNVGVLMNATPATRVGVTYRSRVDLDLSGRQRVTLANGAEFGPQTFDIRADLALPAMAAVSAVHDVNDRWAVLGDVTWYQWSAIQQLVPRNAATGVPSTPLDLRFRDSVRLSAALNYRLSEAWLLRGGLAWDQAPVASAQDRTANQPDSDRTWISAGARWDLNAAHRIDFAYAFVMLASASIEHTVTNAGTLRGNYDNHAHIFAAQYTYS